MRVLTISILIAISTQILSSQTAVQNSSMEEWVYHSSGLFQEPGDWWGTLNMLRLLGSAGPVTTSPSTDAHSGEYSAMIENKLFGTTIKIGGLLSTGFFDTKQTPPNNFIAGRPFSGRPIKLVFWYKFKPVNGDSCGVGLYLTKWNIAENRADTIGKCSKNYFDQGEMNEFVRAEIPILYFSEETPDTINIAFIASAGIGGAGSSANAVIGSIFWVDDVALDYTVGIELPLMGEGKVVVKAVYNAGILSISSELENEGNRIYIYDINGRFILANDLNSGRSQMQFNMPQGNYFFIVKSGNKTIDGGIFNY